MTRTNYPTKVRLLAALTALAACPLMAFELPVFKSISTNLPPVDIHGFVSQGYIANSGTNNYFGQSSGDGTIDFREYGLSASAAQGKWRAGAQVFGQKLGPYGDDKIKLDWANVDYQAEQWIGVRAGRVKMPRGLYNESLDLDSTRPFVFLPQSVYDARLRDFQASFDGGMLYGNVDLHKFGSLDYKVFGGMKKMSTHSGASDYFNSDIDFPVLAFEMDDIWGGTIFWNTPLQGLRVGYSFSRFDNFNTERLKTHAGPVIINPPYPIWKNAPTYDRHLASVEYTIGNWVFATEGGVDNTVFDLYNPAASPTLYGHLYPNMYYYYVSAAWQATRRLELGTYYSQYHWEQTAVGTPNTFHDKNQADFALCAKYDVSDYVTVKLEGHYMDGWGALFDTPAANATNLPQDSWFMIAAKLTFTF